VVGVQRVRVEEVRELNRNFIDTEAFDSVVYLVRPRMELMHLIANHVHAAHSTTRSRVRACAHVRVVGVER
jgi:hypothetical protein